jgi:hypothetical protein
LRLFKIILSTQKNLAMKNIKKKEIHHKKYSEYFITFNQTDPKLQNIEKLLGEIRKDGISVIYGTILGNPRGFKTFGKILKNFPVVYIGESERWKNMNNWGMFIYALKSKDIEIKYLYEKDEIIGTYYRLPNGIEGIYLKSPENHLSPQINFEKEALKRYTTLERNLKKNKFTFQDAYRFWNYMEDINSNYLSFNKARNHYFRKNKIIDYPAATGIEAVLSDNQNINISLEALKIRDKKQTYIDTIKSDFQCDANVYGPKFSRAKMISFKEDKLQKLLISGTSSVNLKGNSIFTENYEKNVKYVMSCVEHLLGKVHMRYKDIVMSRVYSKNASIENEFMKLYAKKKWNFPYNKLLSNICRESFIFEIECVAAKKFEKI